MANRENAYADQGKLLSSKYDNLFKAIVSGGWCVKSDGNVEAPSGYFALTEIPSHPGEFQEMMDALNAGEPASMQHKAEDFPTPGWYVSMELNTGLIYVVEYPSRPSAEKTYQELNENFTNWATEDEAP